MIYQIIYRVGINWCRYCQRTRFTDENSYMGSWYTQFIPIQNFIISVRKTETFLYLVFVVTKIFYESISYYEWNEVSWKGITTFRGRATVLKFVLEGNVNPRNLSIDKRGFRRKYNSVTFEMRVGSWSVHIIFCFVFRLLTTPLGALFLK